MTPWIEKGGQTVAFFMYLTRTLRSLKLTKAQMIIKHPTNKKRFLFFFVSL